MPDKIDYTDDLMENAWADMRLRLDTAMPVASKRKRGLYWYWLAAAAALLLLLALPALWPTNTPSDLSPASTTAKAPATPTQSLPPVPVLKESSAPVAVLTDEVSAPISISIRPAIVQQQEPIVVDNPIIADGAVNTAPAQIVEIGALPTLSAQLLLTDLPAIEVQEKVVAAHRPLHMFSDLTVLANQAEAPAGFGISLGVSKAIGERWSIETGLAYRFHRWHIQDAASDGIYFQEATRNLFENTFVSAGSPAIPVDLIKEHALELPLVARYRLGKRLSVYGGAALSYNIANYVGVDRQNRAIDPTPVDTNGTLNPGNDVSADVAWYNSDPDTRIARSVTNRFRTDALIGTRFRLAPRWAIQLDARYDLVPPIQRDVAELNRGFLSVGVRHYWR